MRPTRTHAVGLLLLASCGGGSDDAQPAASADGGASTNGAGSSTSTPATGEAFKPATSPSGWDGFAKRGIPNPGGKCTSKGGTPMKLPVSAVEYCVKASASCSSAGASCPLYVTINTDGAFFPRVDDATNGELIVVELYTETDGNDVKDKMAETPRVVANDYSGLDKSRIYAVGWSAGAGAVARGLCHIAKKSDFSSLGTTGDIYAAVIAMGGCGCSNNYAQLSGNWHVLTWNGTEDVFGGADSCEAGLRQRATVNGCAKLDATWSPAAASDPFSKNADGSANAERLDFGACNLGDVMGYRFKDEGHVVSAKSHFAPSISGYDTIWRFLQGRKK